MRSLVVPVLMVLVSVTPASADSEAGKKMAKQKCQVCHGIDGIAKIPIAPHLAGESQIYLETQLKAFRSGKREHEMMTVVAKGLKDGEITSLSQWYSSIKITATMPE
ncbi:c-type cytochrome [Anderseniella sp. Alg231-50]|uniref:c-type cytochrome n=1 Tax=Anderseniella sp. Alg231-50 TaxID=1922226 RepID=UPI00307BE73A